MTLAILTVFWRSAEIVRSRQGSNVMMETAIFMMVATTDAEQIIVEMAICSILKNVMMPI